MRGSSPLAATARSRSDSAVVVESSEPEGFLVGVVNDGRTIWRARSSTRRWTRFRMSLPSGEFGRRLLSAQLVASWSFAGSGKRLLWAEVEVVCDSEGRGRSEETEEEDKEDDANNEVEDEEDAIAVEVEEAGEMVGIRVRNWASPARVVNCRIMLLSSSRHFESDADLSLSL